MLSKNQLREIRSLHLKKFRENRKLFIAEGAKTVSEIILQRPELVKDLYAENGFTDRFAALIKKRGIAVTEISEEELRGISLQANPNQVLAVCRQPDRAFDLPQGQAFNFYLDDIRDPGNFGTILRVCDWFGANKLYCSPESCELYNPKVIQASMGAFLRIDVNYMTLQAAVQDSGKQRIYGAVLGGADLYSEKLADGLIVIGNEANGIAEKNIKLINSPLTIPAHPANGSESLNAAMAAGIIAAEFYRQLR